MEDTVLRLLRLIELVIETPLCLNEKAVKELKVGEMMRHLYMVFIWILELYISCLAKFASCFAGEGGASI